MINFTKIWDPVFDPHGSWWTLNIDCLEDIPRDLVTQFLCARKEVRILVYDQGTLFTEDIALFSPEFKNNFKKEIEKMLPLFRVVQVFRKENPRTWKEVFDIFHPKSLLQPRETKFAVTKEQIPRMGNFLNFMVD